MAKRKRRNRKAQRKISISKTLALLAPQLYAWQESGGMAGWNAGAAGAARSYVSALSVAYTGVNLQTRTVDIRDAAIGWGPLVAAKGISIAKRQLGNPSFGPLPVTL